MITRTNRKSVLEEEQTIVYMGAQGNAVGLVHAMNLARSIFTDVYFDNGDVYNFYAIPKEEYRNAYGVHQ